MKSLGRSFFLIILFGATIFVGLACKVNTPTAPHNYLTALKTIVAGNPTLTFTPTYTPTTDPTFTPTPTNTFFPGCENGGIPCTSTITPTATSTTTTFPSSTPTITSTITPTPTVTPTFTVSTTPTFTTTIFPSSTPTSTPTVTPTPTPTCAGSFGFPVAGSTPTDLSSYQNNPFPPGGTPVPVYLNQFQTSSAAVTLINITLAVGSGGTSFEAGIYSDTGANAPNTLISETGGQPVINDGLNMAPVTATLSPNTKYWLAFITDGTIYTAPATTLTAYYGSATFGTLPSSLSGSATVSSSAVSEFDIYGSTCP